MKLVKFTAVSCMAAAAFAVPAFAEDPIPGAEDGFAPYGDPVEGWNVFIDAERQACLIERTDDFGHAVQIGLTNNKKHAYIGVFTLADVDIKNKQKVEIDINGFVFDGKARGMKSKDLRGEYKGAYFVIKDDNMVNAIMQEGTLTAFPKKTKQPIKVNLTGVSAAVEAARTCTDGISG
ncbi:MULTISPECIES: hypothetical protein [Ruegeria]|uniref:Invasion protein B, involved in pathogenesis n=1 Tax=Ruegeria atlantica TaxID=81569 RepID=A0A0P1EB00_9RHOB|nr:MULTISPECIES: hypothetical protein [Ruegeria]CUH46630.1 hypothetical protein RUA4292_00796 [Ruegeria atlantica]